MHKYAELIKNALIPKLCVYMQITSNFYAFFNIIAFNQYKYVNVNLSLIIIIVFLT